jgi:hypothetical protein
MITQHGPLCEVCNQYILPAMPPLIRGSQSINPFCVLGCTTELHCHDNCKAIVIAAMEAKDGTLLSPGRLRAAYAAQIEKGGEP